MKSPDRAVVAGELLRVYTRLVKLFDSAPVARRVLKRALEEGQVVATMSVVERGSEGTAIEWRSLPAKFWRNAKVDASHNEIVVRSSELNLNHYHYSFYLQQREADALWPSSSNQPVMVVSNEARWRKASTGAKADYDWEAMLIEAALYAMRKKGKVKSLKELCDHIEAWCGDDAPSESQLKQHLGPLYNELKKI